MTQKTTLSQLILIAATLACSGFADVAVAQRQMESLTRGVTAVPMSAGRYLVSWRLLGNDPDAIAFNVYRTAADGAAERINAAPISDATSFVVLSDQASAGATYFVRPMIDGVEGQASTAVGLAATT